MSPESLIWSKNYFSVGTSPRPSLYTQATQKSALVTGKKSWLVLFLRPQLALNK